MKELLSAKSGKELLEKISALYAAFRSWMQDNGEVSFLIGIALGAVLILFFKIVMIALILLAIFTGIWWIWLEQHSAE